MGATFEALSPPASTQAMSSVSAAAAMTFSERHAHVVDANAFSREDLHALFARADEMTAAVEKNGGCDVLQGKIMSTLFYEPSTRTRLSFEAAMRRLGGAVISTESAAEFSSAAKGESLQDTIRTVHGYCDVIVLRHSVPGSCAAAAEVSDVPVINAGDGPGQHPTQAMLDTYTIRKELGEIEGKRVALVGDLANGRTVRSLASMLAMYPGVSFVFVAPDVVKMKDDVKQMLDAKGVPWEEARDLKEVAADVDVMYMTRIQRERFADNPEDYAKAKGKYVVDTDVLGAMRSDAIVMHPLPRLDEIDVCVDDDPRYEPDSFFRSVSSHSLLSVTDVASVFRVRPPALRICFARIAENEDPMCVCVCVYVCIRAGLHTSVKYKMGCTFAWHSSRCSYRIPCRCRRHATLIEYLTSTSFVHLGPSPSGTKNIYICIYWTYSSRVHAYT